MLTQALLACLYLVSKQTNIIITSVCFCFHGCSRYQFIQQIFKLWSNHYLIKSNRAASSYCSLVSTGDKPKGRILTQEQDWPMMLSQLWLLFFQGLFTLPFLDYFSRKDQDYHLYRKRAMIKNINKNVILDTDATYLNNKILTSSWCIKNC